MLLYVLLGASLLGLAGGVAGSFALLRRQSLLGDALAHAALPGVCLAFLLTGSKATGPLLAGAMAAGLAGALLILAVVRGSRVKEDSAIGIVLSVFFGFGVVLLTRIQKLPGGNQSGLDKFLFGQAATLGRDDVLVLAATAVAVLAVVVLLFKEFGLVTFDRGFAATLGRPVRGLEIALTVLLVGVVVVGLRTVGVVLMVATLLTPAAAARQWTDRLGGMVALAGLFGALTGGAGALASGLVPRLPTGPTIVLLASAVLGASLLFAPRRGLVRAALRDRAARVRVSGENLLKDLYRAGEPGGTWGAPVPVDDVRGGREVRKTARRLARRGLVEVTDGGLALRPAGVQAGAAVLRRHRLWEAYLSRRLDLPADHLHRDAEMMEHVLSEEMVAEIEALLGHPSVDPHGRPIPGGAA